MKKMLALCAALLMVVLVSGTATAATVVTVTESNPQEWLVGPFGTAPTVTWAAGPGTPPEGAGSYQTEISVANSKTILVRNDYHDQPLANLQTFTYWTYLDSSHTMATPRQFYVNLYVDSNGDSSYDTRLDYVPELNGTVQTDTWQLWDAAAGTWDVSTGGQTTLADFLAANPNARVNAFDAAEGGAVRLNMGDTASTYVGFVGALDAVTITFTGVSDTTWDFEAVGPELLQNRSFELASSVWQTLYTGPDEGRTLTGLAFDGSYIMAGQSDGTTEYIQQTVNTSGTDGTTFTFSFYVAGRNLTNDGAFAGQLEFRNGGSTVNTVNCFIPNRGTFNWVQISCEASATGSYDSIVVRVGWTGITSGQGGIDLLSLTQK